MSKASGWLRNFCTQLSSDNRDWKKSAAHLMNTKKYKENDIPWGGCGRERLVLFKYAKIEFTSKFIWKNYLQIVPHITEPKIVRQHTPKDKNS